MEGLHGDRRQKRKGKVKSRRKRHWRLESKEKKVGVSAVPFYDGLVDFAVFSPVAVDCKNRASGSNIVEKYLFFCLET